MTLTAISTILILIVAVRLAYVANVTKSDSYISASASFFLAALINIFLILGYLVNREFTAI